MDILVFDDNLVVMEMLVLILKNAGHKITAFHSTHDILDFALSESSGFQVIVSDYSILDVMDFAPLRMLQHTNPDAKTIIISGMCLDLDQNLDRLRAIGLRIDGCLVKPFNVRKLLELINNVTEGTQEAL